MKELELQKFLRGIKLGALTALEFTYKVNYRRHEKYDNLVLFKYNQLESPMHERICQESRGIILDEQRNWEVVSYGYNKFFNYGEANAASIDWQKATIYEKLDGSLCQLYYYDNEWRVATSGTPDASGEVGSYKKTFKDLFWEVWNELGYLLPKDKNKTYLFELMTPYNRIVVRHLKNRIVLHGARHKVDFFEYRPDYFDTNWEVVKTFNFNSIENVLDSVEKLNPLESEGFIVCDANFNRVKVKNAQYVAMSHLAQNMSFRSMLEVIRKNESSEFLVHFPEFAELFYKTKIKYESLISEINGFFEGIKHISNQKDFALLATQKTYSAALFRMKAGKVRSFKDYLKDIPIKNLEGLLEKY